MRMYHSRLMTSVVLAIFLTSISVVLIAWACDSLKADKERYEKAVKDQEDKIETLEAKGYMSSISEGAYWGMGVGFGLGVIETVSSGPFAPVTAIPAIAKSTVLGGFGGAAYGGITHHQELSAERDELSRLRIKLTEAKQAYYDCLHPPAKYTYTDYSGYVWEFTVEAYGSDEAAYNAYMNFIASKGN